MLIDENLWTFPKVEICPYARSILSARMTEGFLHAAPIHEDVKVFRASPTTPAEGCGGGFPCQAPVPVTVVKCVERCLSACAFIFNLPGDILRGQPEGFGRLSIQPAGGSFSRV